jgi:hypothetical protein
MIAMEDDKLFLYMYKAIRIVNVKSFGRISEAERKFRESRKKAALKRKKRNSRK